MCEILYTSIITFFYNNLYYFYNTNDVGEKEATSEWSSITCLFFSYNPLEPGDFLRAYSHVETLGLTGKA